MVAALKSLRPLAAALCVLAAPAMAETVEVTDIVGRTVSIERPVERFVISEGRYIPLLALLRPEAPVAGVVGMMTTLGWTQPGLEAQLYARFPKARDIPLFGHRSADSVSVERIIDLKPEVAIFGIGDHGPGAENAELIAQLEAAGIAVLFIDFRMDPLNNTIPSVALIGRVLGAEDRAAAYSDFYRERRRAVLDRVAAATTRPTVFMQVHPGRRECCWGMADGMLGPFVAQAGGINIADAAAPGPTTQHTAEFLIVEDPDVWIGTASGTADENARGDPPVALGPGMSPDAARDSLRRYLAAPEFAPLTAVRTGRAHVFWHNFYNSPFNVVVLEALAGWLHPDLFADTDPQQTLERIFKDFLPFELDGTYFATASRD
ncbi:ABC transporter substrate-binding protein [Thalassobaculum salexigens]|uniref:ABC transporter substrate-binding protein n=1 Tax=Thalassobaculum salexigens TaxID=455360 RepID=UPI00248D9777|nr:ABC transporter substrate-binding protein [Thalassobaculum salexigens]